MEGCFLQWMVLTGLLVLCGVRGQECPYDAPLEASNGCVEDGNLPQELIMGPDVDFLDNTNYPYIVSLQTLLSGNHELGTGCYKHFCGGTMIAPNLILTAAHCFDDLKIQHEKLDGQLFYSPKVAIYAAISPRCRHLSNKKYGRMKVNQIFIHPEYENGIVPKNDVAVIQVFRLKGKYYEGPLVQVVDKAMEDAEEALVIGYGEAQPAHVGQYIVYPLHGAQLSLISLDTCKELLDFQDDISSTQLNYSSMVCYLNLKADPCNGDSGGPLLDNGVQVALVSWGTAGQCQQFNRLQPPGVFVRLTSFVDWIQQIVQEFGVATTQKNTVQELEANVLLALEGAKPSSWVGLNACDDWTGINCENNRVIDVLMINKGLKGTLPPQLTVLDQLERLEFENNNFTGTLPVEFSSFSKLRHLEVWNNQLTGTIPDEYTALTRLQILNVGGNNLQGTLPVQYSKFPSLRHFFTYQNNLKGTLPPQYSQLSSLQSVGFWQNSLTGTLPLQYSRLVKVKRLELYNNKFTGTVPRVYSKLGQVLLFPQEGSLCVERMYESIVNDLDKSSNPYC